MLMCLCACWCKVKHQTSQKAALIINNVSLFDQSQLPPNIHNYTDFKLTFTTFKKAGHYLCCIGRECSDPTESMTQWQA